MSGGFVMALWGKEGGGGGEVSESGAQPVVMVIES